MNNPHFASLATLGLFVASLAFAQTPPAADAPPPPPGASPAVNATPAPPGGTDTAAAAPPLAPGAESAGMFSGMMDPFDYDSRGRRDPFVQPIPDRPLQQGGVHGPLLPLQRFDLSQLKLTGIIWEVRHPKAMLKDPTGNVHIVGTNTKVGPRNGYIAIIREGEIVVVETEDQDGHLVSTAQVMKLAR